MNRTDYNSFKKPMSLPQISAPRSLKWVFLLLCLCLLLSGNFFKTETVLAASAKPATIQSCKITGSNKITVTASLSSTKAIAGSKCYLFAMDFSRSTLTASSRPITSQKKALKMTFSCKLNPQKNQTRLYSGFVLAAKNAGGQYTIISNKKYISNPQKIAKYKSKFPTAVSKKGLQVNADMMEDAVDLNVRNSVINIVFSQLIAPKSQQNKALSYSYKYQGKTYWFSKSAVLSYDRQLKALKSTSSVNSAVLLLDWRDDLTHLIYPDGRQRGHSYYAWNTVNSSARQQLQATMSFLAKRYSPSNGKYGRIVNWIVGNEVNNYQVYNYAGQKTLSQYAKIYADAFRLTHQTITSIYSNARIYISLDHLWNTNYVSGTFASRKMLDTFAAKLKSGGNIRWNLAYHPYSSPLTEPKFWANINGQLTNSLTSPVINMGNIHLLTSYIRKTYGSQTRIILSEQGYTSRQASQNTETLQAAAIAYTYLLAEADNMIDAVIIHRHVDHQVEIQQGLNLGLWNTGGSSPEWASTQKQSWNVFKYMDSSRSTKVTSFAPAAIGAKSWTDLIPGYSQKLYNKVSYTLGTLKTVKSYKKTASIPKSWQKYGAVTSSQKGKSSIIAVHDARRNPNCLWGFTQSFKKGLSFKSSSSLCTTLKVDGAQRATVQVKIRFYSGRKIFECSSQIPTGKNVNLKVSLKNWKYKNKVTKIQILISPAQMGGWKSGASVHMSLPVRAK